MRQRPINASFGGKRISKIGDDGRIVVTRPLLASIRSRVRPIAANWLS